MRSAAFAIGFLGPFNAAKYIAYGLLVGLVFWVLMYVLLTDKPSTKTPEQRQQDYHLLQEQMNGKWYLCTERPSDPQCPKWTK